MDGFLARRVAFAPVWQSMTKLMVGDGHAVVRTQRNPRFGVPA